MAHIFQQRLVPCAPSCVSPDLTLRSQDEMERCAHCYSRTATARKRCRAVHSEPRALPSHFYPRGVCAFISWQLGFGRRGRQPGLQRAEPERCPWLGWEQGECSPSHGWAKCVWVTERAGSQGCSSQRRGSWIHLVLKGVFSSQIGRAIEIWYNITAVYSETSVGVE